MSSRIVRGDDRIKKVRVSADGSAAAAEFLGQDHAANVEKQAFEQGYQEGERIGKQMGEKMVAAAVQRYDRGVAEIASLHQALRDAMEREAVRLALAVARRIVVRELSLEPDLVAALVSVALKRVQGQAGITARVSPHDFPRLDALLRAGYPDVTVKEDASLERGDFMLDSAQTHVDGRLSSQIDAIARALLDA